jgi:hypothetical protein
MVLEKDELIKIISSEPALKNFMGFLSAQEVERMAEVLRSALLIVEQNRKLGSVDFKQWLTVAKDKVVKELVDSQKLFGFKDLPQRFPVDDFLQAYLQNVK